MTLVLSSFVTRFGIFMAALHSWCGHYIFICGFFFFSSLNISGCRLDVYHTFTCCSLSVNLECRSEMCCTRLARNTGHKNDAKNRHLRKLRPTNDWDRFGSLGHRSKFQRVSRLAFITAATSLTGGQQNFARCLVVFYAGTLYIQFRGLLPPGGFSQVQNSLYVQLLRSAILAALLYGTPAAAMSRALQHGTRNGIANFRRGRHLYSAGRPLRWASANILVYFYVMWALLLTYKLYMHMYAY